MKKTFLETTHLSEIIEKSHTEPVIVFKFSNECGTSSKLKKELEKAMEANVIENEIYLVTVQKHKVLSQKIEDMLEIKHESPQIIILHRGKVTYTDHHKDIKIENFKCN